MKYLLSFILTLGFLVSNGQDPAKKTRPTKGVFSKVEKKASFPGSDVGWRRFLEQNLNANIPADNNAPAGKYTVMVQFIVSKDGYVSDVTATTKHGYGMEAEVIRVIKKTGKWVPAMQNGKPVTAYRRQPVTFYIEEDEPVKDTDSLTQHPEVIDGIYIIVDEDASFPGGNTAWGKFLQQNLRTKEIAKKIKFPKNEKILLQRVEVRFITEKDGNISEIEVSDDIDPLLRYEAMRIMKISPKWIPAKRDGQSVSSYSAQPILFEIHKK